MNSFNNNNQDTSIFNIQKCSSDYGSLINQENNDSGFKSCLTSSQFEKTPLINPRKKTVDYSDVSSNSKSFQRILKTQVDFITQQSNIELREPLLIDNQHNTHTSFTFESFKPNVIQKRDQRSNRLAIIQRIQHRLPSKQEINQSITWSWDTSGALIRRMQMSRATKLTMNIYIWVLLMLRVLYVSLIMIFFLSQQDNDPDYQNYKFWLVICSFVMVRLMFSLIVLKLLSVGHQIKDPKIRIVYLTYYNIAQKYEKKGKVFTLSLQSMMVIIPPEFSFIFVMESSGKYKSGYYQVQNMIMKSLELFFFVPCLVYFLSTHLSGTDKLLNGTDFPITQNQAIWIVYVFLIVDTFFFILLNIWLLFSNQRRKQPKSLTLKNTQSF